MDDAAAVINWTICSSGYLGAYIGERGKNGKRKNVYKHRWIWEQAYGPIPPKMQIHHKDGNQLNNALNNLKCVSHKEHRKIHGPDRTPPKPLERRFSIACSLCGIVMQRKLTTVSPKCARCSMLLAEEKRKTPRICEYCGKTFVSRFGCFCSQRCVNLGARWKTARLQPDS